MPAKLRLLAACCLCFFAAPSPAAAEWHFTPLIGAAFRGSTTLVDPEAATGNAHRSFGGDVALLGPGIFGVEGVVVFTPRFFQDKGTVIESSRVTALMANVVLTGPRRWTEYSLRPFVSGGFGLLRVSKTETGREVFPVHTNLGGFNFGGGAIGFLSQRTGVRFDLRYYSIIPGSDIRDEQGAVAIGDVHLRYMVASVGVVIRR